VSESEDSTATPGAGDFGRAQLEPPSGRPVIAQVADEAPPPDGEAAVAAAPEVLASSLREYLAVWGRRIRNGESGALPIFGGMVAIVVFFQLENSHFLTSGNLVNLFVQSTIYIMFGAAELFALLLSEIDLSVGYAAGVGAFAIAELIAPPVGLPWWLGIAGGVAFTSLLGFIQGSLITRLGLPSFVVTLGGLLAFEGLMLELANVDKTAVGGVMTIDSNSPVAKLVQTRMSVTLAWVVLAVVLALFAATALARARQRRTRGLSGPPLSVTVLTIALTAVGGIALVAICNSAAPAGVPWVVPFVLSVLLLWTWLLGRTRLGRYIYAIGANPEAARRAGINVPRIRTIGFVLCGLTAGLAGLVYESNLGSIATDIDGGSLVLYAVAAAVIGGASLFGGRGRPLHALLGGLVVAAVFNGLGLMGISDAGDDMATALVLIAAVALDSLVRRRATSR